ncbi:response regulator [Acetatifactor muris]|uniref:Stage 0 sporulation protein A homolog n=1 Tax=Acetatifactor muris TaxID=879566 RepID=A0A2K4ZIW1_9FIRM|nr:response regulator [Acetatifactor muris]MCR2045929.1 response regulator [Acetatifactor muris]SOY30418.1 Autoinducer 2 sensor kinase/phosphatase LuxQ [Acetatifactor muris]
MYHCHVHFYFTGQNCRVFEIIKESSRPENFTYTFAADEVPEKNAASEADVIVANLQGMDAVKTVRTLISGKSEEARLILVAERMQMDLLTGELPEIEDIWISPMTEEEIKFRFNRWQDRYKQDKDYWQTSHFFEATINNIPNLIWYKDKNGIHEKVNDSFCRTVNKTKEQVEGRGHAYIWDVEQDDPACIESEREVMTKKRTFVSEEIIKTGEGMRTLTTYKSPLYDIDGSVMGTVGVAIDVTQERAYEEEIVQKNRTLEALFTTIDCGVICHTIDGSRILSINRAALQILGYRTPEDLMEEGFDMIASSVLEEDREALQESIEDLKKEGDSVSVEYRIRHKSGDILHIMGNVKLIRENGELFYQRFLLDCTAQKQQEKQNERRQMELVKALSIDYSLVCYFDLETGSGRLLQDDEGRQIFGSVFDGNISLEESMGRYIEEFVYEEDQDMLRQASLPGKIKQELEEKMQYYVNYRVHGAEGVRYFQVKAVRAGAWDDETRGIVLGFRSVDDEIRSEMEQKRLLEDALLQANKASKAKSVFLSNMSHDIRTPMNAIVGFTALAITHVDHREQVEEYLKKIMTSGNHLLSLINDVLDMSRIESGKIHLEEKPCSLPDILHGLRNILQADINAKQLELYMDTVDVWDEEIYCDKLRLNQVLLNLLSNSVKYTGAGGIVSMRVTEKAGAPAGHAIYEFCIRDTGIGMSEEFVAHIFEPFEREENTTISGIQGTGLGMAITKNIVDMMNGTIEVKSEQGVGTEFRACFTFRLDTGVKEPYDIAELKNCRALVVDDDFNTCDSVSYMLQQIGMRAEWTLSGKEAVLRTHQALMRGDSYSVYIIDWLLPDMNGIEVTRRIRKEMGEEVPVIVLTAYDWSDIEDEAKEAGVTAFCSKPLFLSELRSCLRSVINAEEEEEEKEQEELVRHHTGRILLAEDVELNQEIAVAILGDAGFTTEVAENGRIAVEMLRKSQPGYYQLVLMDVQMPVMNGYEAAKAIRKLENRKLASIPIIAMTANAFEEDRKEALASGMNGHIAKPIDVDNLISTLDEILG